MAFPKPGTRGVMSLPSKTALPHSCRFSGLATKLDRTDSGSARQTGFWTGL